MALPYITHSDYDTFVKTLLNTHICIEKKWNKIYQVVNNGGYLYVVELWEDFLFFAFFSLSQIRDNEHVLFYSHGNYKFSKFR